MERSKHASERSTGGPVGTRKLCDDHKIGHGWLLLLVFMRRGLFHHFSCYTKIVAAPWAWFDDVRYKQHNSIGHTYEYNDPNPSAYVLLKSSPALNFFPPPLSESFLVNGGIVEGNGARKELSTDFVC